MKRSRSTRVSAPYSGCFAVRVQRIRQRYQRHFLSCIPIDGLLIPAVTLARKIGGQTTMNPLQTLDNAMTTIVSEIFQNGREEGNRIWVNVNHPLHQAIRILLRAQLRLQSSEAVMLR